MLFRSLLKAKRDVEKQATKYKSMSGSSSSNAREAELQSEVDKCMVSLPCLNARRGTLTFRAELAEVFDLQDEPAQHRYHEVHAL